MKEAYFAGGCFWCLTPAFRATEGVESVISGYSGGDEENPRYEDVKAQKTGHRETIRVIYDPQKVSFAELLDLYLHDVDPFDRGGQFIDRGHSYTLAVYWTDEAQKAASQEGIAALEARFGQKAAIALEPFKSFYPAEDYHQDYDLKNPEAFAEELRSSGRVKD